MTLIEYKSHFFETLKGKYPVEEIGSFFTLIMEHYLQWTRAEMALDPAKKIPTDKTPLLEKALKELNQFKPVQYIMGNCHFYDLTFHVNEYTLIPRPETEELITWTLENTAVNKPIRILDVGTGSGCIAITLAKHLPNATVYAVDISEKALDTAQRNALNSNTKVSFILGDVMNMETLPHELDIIISNPPYVTEKEKESMRTNVLQFEPSEALFVPDDDALLFYKRLAELGTTLLKSKGEIFVEINQTKGLETCQVFEKKGFSTTLKKDIFGADRMIHAVKHQH